jgi:hypothetical protein
MIIAAKILAFWSTAALAVGLFIGPQLRRMRKTQF